MPWRIHKRPEPPRKKVFWDKTFFFRFYAKGRDENAKIEFHIQTRYAPSWRLAARFHVGNAGSETPWDGHLIIFGLAIYWGLDNGRKLAHKLTSKPGEYDGRDLSLELSDGTLRWQLWGNSDRWVKGKIAKWRSNSINVDPRNSIWGRKQYKYIDADRHVGKLVLPEGEYPVILTLQQCFLLRVKSQKILEQSWTVDVDVPRGVPSHFDHSGGYKGDRTYGFGVTLPNDQRARGWELSALQLAAGWVLTQRGKTGFREPQELEVDL